MPKLQPLKPTFDFDKLDTIKGNKLPGGNYSTIFKAIVENKSICIKKMMASEHPSKIPDDSIENEINILNELTKLKSNFFVDFIGFAKKEIDTYYFHYFLVMEWLPYCLNYEICNKDFSSYTWQQRHHMMITLVAAIQLLHDVGIIHADIKSGNVLLTEQFTPKLCDFGFSEKGDATAESCGTVSHAAPEILSGDKATRKSDIYSLAMLLWEILAWEEPYPGTTNYQIVFFVVRNDLRKNIPVDTPPNITKAIQLAWDKDPEKRPDAKQLLDLVCTESNVSYRAL